MDFNPIETQEQFDEVIRERLARENKKYEGWTSPDKLQEIKDGYEKNASKKYEGYTSPEDLQTMKNNYESQLEIIRKENTSLKASQLRSKVANEFKLPTEMASRLQGTTEEELRTDAKTLAELVSTNKAVVLPLHDGSTGGSTNKNAAIKELLSQFKD
jgi:hypothetical protein